MVMVDRERGWVVGEGVILRTDDGGLRWRRQRLPGPSASMRLVSAGAIDALNAVVVGVGGIVLRTEDGGGSWQQISRPAVENAVPPTLRNEVFCSQESGGGCWSAGRGLEWLESGTDSWKPERFDDYASAPEIHFDLGQVELSTSEEERLKDFLVSNRQRTSLEWVLDPGLDSRELETIGRDRDPSAVFDLIEARLQEVRTVIEEGGVSPDRIALSGEPPWDYEDYLDEDAHFLDRYWVERLALGSGLRIVLHDPLMLEALWIGDSGLGLAVGRSGAIARSEDGGGHWQTLPRATPYDLFAVGVGGRRAVTVGAQGGVWTSEDEGRHWALAALDLETDSFDTLRGISFSPSGEIGFVVGDKGRILRSLDGGETWAELVAP